MKGDNRKPMDRFGDLKAEIKMLTAEVNKLRDRALKGGLGKGDDYIIRIELRTITRVDAQLLRERYPDVAEECSYEKETPFVYADKKR
jgi:hypothetical protein